MKTTNPVTQYRETNSISQPQLAVRADLSISTLSGLESGRLDPLHVRPKTWRKLAKAMKRDVVALREELISWYEQHGSASEKLRVFFMDTSKRKPKVSS